jgi:phenylacetate-CoA ligase
VVKNLVGLREVQVAQLAPGRFEFRLVPITGSDLAAAQEQAPQNVDKYFGPRQTVTSKIMDHIPREPVTSGLRRVVTCGARRTRRR